MLKLKIKAEVLKAKAFLASCFCSVYMSIEHPTVSTSAFELVPSYKIIAD
jgi:hypothetical protein